MGDSSALVDLTKASSDEVVEIRSQSEDTFGDEDDDDYNYEGFDDMMAEATTSGTEADDVAPVFFYETLWANDVYKEMMDAAQEMAAVVNLPKDDVLRLLSRYDWNTARFQEHWFGDFDENMDSVSSQCLDAAKDGCRPQCNICFEEFQDGGDQLLDCGCGHSFCTKCWSQYISSKAENAASCLRIDCPMPKCGRMVKSSMMAKISQPEDLEKIKAAWITNFVDKIGYICVCPGVDCSKYVKVHEYKKGVLVKDVRCSWCHTDFCFDCLGEAHRPVGCELVRQWDLKNATDRANMNWIISHTKACPSCNRPIEKNKGCMHMHCTRCNHHFCWLCMKDWSRHGENTGGYYSCTLFEKEKKEQDPQEKKRQEAKRNLSRHLQFFERWSEHDRAMKILSKAKENWEKVEKEKLSNSRNIPVGALDFVSEAWDVVNRCRRVLKWTYVAAYFAFATDSKEDKEISNSLISDKISSQKREEYKAFFDFSNQEAEISLERLSHKVETELQEFIPNKFEKGRKRKPEDTPSPKKDFGTFRNEVIGLSSVTKDAFEKMTQFLENGLDKSIQSFNT